MAKIRDLQKALESDQAMSPRTQDVLREMSRALSSPAIRAASEVAKTVTMSPAISEALKQLTTARTIIGESSLVKPLPSPPPFVPSVRRDAENQAILVGTRDAVFALVEAVESLVASHQASSRKLVWLTVALVVLTAAIVALTVLLVVHG
jgi:hypothetical protein